MEVWFQRSNSEPTITEGEHVPCPLMVVRVGPTLQWECSEVPMGQFMGSFKKQSIHGYHCHHSAKTHTVKVDQSNAEGLLPKPSSYILFSTGLCFTKILKWKFSRYCHPFPGLWEEASLLLKKRDRRRDTGISTNERQKQRSPSVQAQAAESPPREPPTGSSLPHCWSILVHNRPCTPSCTCTQEGGKGAGHGH